MLKLLLPLSILRLPLRELVLPMELPWVLISPLGILMLLLKLIVSPLIKELNPLLLVLMLHLLRFIL